ncbi:cytochrome o ubiquinol oxidase subunit IV [Breoghania sp.]|uniref:cytochrome o ubiquinol oxidase subunit IV n=1 Tax=Breoghania sp. TaxID=2065378 RepID=UPI0026276D28|nr:cytochrome o ubiquinol oxidase subunit IV [Breoghania sp.]MDJ0933008.1 cytochrome o ubiquinol oxidase subunit IV [Breoghania sp.]
MSAEEHVMNTHDDHHDTAPAHATLSGYIKGFLLSVILTAIPFHLVMTGALDNQTTVAVIMAMAVIQIIVYMIYFLHMDAKSEGGWNFLSMVFTLIIVAITLSGSLWVMYHLNMMPQHDMSQLP